MDKEKTKLKPCFMCGGDNLEIKTFNSTWIECKNKECRLESGCFDTVEIAIEKWNTRENPADKALTEIGVLRCDYYHDKITRHEFVTAVSKIVLAHNDK